MTLGRGESGEVDLAKVLRWSQDDLITYSPITEAHVNSGLSLRDLARAALVASDNTAANLLLDYFGGPSALTEFWRSIGDDVSRLDRYEPELNLVPDGTELDTTSPFAMARTVNELLFGNSQHEEVRSQIRAWMMEVKTGLNRLRAGFPEDWVAGDKTGTGIHETRQTYVDLAFGGPVDRKPIVVAAYFEPHLPAKAFSPDILGVLAEVGRIAASETRDPRVRDVFG
jgi:beta-lactamase class A